MIKTIKYLLCLTVLLALPAFTSAQQTDSTSGSTKIIHDQRVDQLVAKHIQLCKEIKTMDGFRIQLFSDSGNNSKNKAQAARDAFQARFPDMEVYLTFKSPNYKVRVGNFRTRLDAQRFLNEISADYPNAFIISDQINLPKAERP